MQNELQTILRTHARQYPQMLPQDAIKLIYQSCFGSGHLIPDEAVCVRRIEDERQTIPASLRPVEDIGNGLGRLYLDEANRLGLSSRTVGRLFMGAQKRQGCSAAGFEDALAALQALTQEGVFGFTSEQLADYLSGYDRAGRPAVSHSEVYRSLYAPAYRLIDARVGRLLPIISAVDKRLASSERTVIALDGRCASGKSTAAGLLAPLWDAPVIHMDDFFLPLPLRTEERMDEPGGNVHYERFIEEVLPGLRDGTAFSYRLFSCAIKDYDGERHVPESPVVIVEGAYSLHPKFGDYADLRYFFDIRPDEQERRILQRNGEQMLKMFRGKWIPLEEKYIQTDKIDENERIL